MVGAEVDISIKNPPGYFGEASKATGIGYSAILSSSSDQSGTFAFGADTSKAGKGWLHGMLLSGCVNSGLTIARNTVTPDTGVWVSAATTYGIYVGAKTLYQLQPGQMPAFSANHNPVVGIALGQTAATSGRSNYLRFIGTDGASFEKTADIYHDGIDLVIRLNGIERVRFANATGSLLVGGLQVVTTRRTGFTLFTGTTNSASVLDPSTVTLQELAQRVAALQQALNSHGLIGA